jgi:hypothetical protein
MLPKVEEAGGASNDRRRICFCRPPDDLLSHTGCCGSSGSWISRAVQRCRCFADLPHVPYSLVTHHKPKHINTMNKATHILLRVAVVLAFPFIYLLLLRPGQPTLSPLQWLLFGSVAFALAVGSFLPSILRQVRGLPPQPVSASVLRFSIALAGVLCPLAFFAVWTFGPLGSLVICLVPLAFAFRFPRGSQPAPGSRNA